MCMSSSSGWIAVNGPNLTSTWRRIRICPTRKPACLSRAGAKGEPEARAVRASWKTGTVEWVHAPSHADYVYYNHAAQVNRGISGQLPRPGKSDADRLSRKASQHGVVSRVSSASENFCGRKTQSRAWTGSRTGKSRGLRGQIRPAKDVTDLVEERELRNRRSSDIERALEPSSAAQLPGWHR